MMAFGLATGATSVRAAERPCDGGGLVVGGMALFFDHPCHRTIHMYNMCTSGDDNPREEQVGMTTPAESLNWNPHTIHACACVRVSAEEPGDDWKTRLKRKRKMSIRAIGPLSKGTAQRACVTGRILFS